MERALEGFTVMSAIRENDEIRVKKGVIASPVPDEQKKFKTARVVGIFVANDGKLYIRTDRELRGSLVWSINDVCLVRDTNKYGVRGRS
jgi:glucose/arabinose dehydrogenase